MCLAENSFIPPGIVHMFQRTVFIPPGIVHMFQRTVPTPPGILRMFQRTVLISPGIVRIFGEQFLYRLGIVSALKRTSFHTKWYFECFSENSFQLHLTALRLRTKSVHQVSCLAKVNFLFFFV